MKAVRRLHNVLPFLGLLFSLPALVARAQSPDTAWLDTAWPTYGGDAGGQRYTTSVQITPKNVTQLVPAWTFHTGALTKHRKGTDHASFEATPILFRNLLYLSSPYDEVFAIDPATGVKQWEFDPRIKRNLDTGVLTSRGVASWASPTSVPSSACATRIFIATMDSRLIAMDAVTGKLCAKFGAHGSVDLASDVFLKPDSPFYNTSPPTVVGNVVIVGSSIGDNTRVDVEDGVVRAFDCENGRLLWKWEPIPWAAQQKLRTGAANAWSVLSADLERGIVYVPTGAPSPDFYGGERAGDNRDANSVVALDASTGKRLWGFQVVHHDLWDYDVAAQPLLFTFRGSALQQTIPAIAIATKQGLIFVLNRVTGNPLYPVTERPVPASDVPGETASPTQPFQDLPTLAPLTVPADAQFGASARDNAECRSLLADLRYDGMYTPPSLRGTLTFPGNLGGVNWGSAALDPATGILYANTNRLAFSLQFKLRSKAKQPPATEASTPHFGYETGLQLGTPYTVVRRQLVAPTSRHPCTPIPWGAVSAINLNTGKAIWQTPLGTLVPGKHTGTPNLGGDLVTASGLLFTAASEEPLLRAFDSATGEELWQGALPVPAQATPMSYTLNGRQYIVIAAGGHGLFGTPTSDAVVAYALPTK